MSDTTPVPPNARAFLTEEQLEKIAGGTCTAAEVNTLLNGLTQTYEALIGTTSYVIERVYNSVK